jgi:hypothetical protein
MLVQLRPISQSNVLRYALLAVALLWALPVATRAYDRLLEVTRDARARLIVSHQLWEMHPEYHGTPENWTRFASRLLTDRQLLRRVRAKYGDQAAQIELDYRSDLTIAQAEVVTVALAAWAFPLAIVVAIGWLSARRRPRPKAPSPPKPRPASYDDPRYLP